MVEQIFYNEQLKYNLLVILNSTFCLIVSRICSSHRGLQKYKLSIAITWYVQTEGGLLGYFVPTLVTFTSQ